MLRATALRGLAVVGLEAVRKIGAINEVILDPDARQIAGFQVSPGSALFGAGQSQLLAASAIRAIGPDAVMVQIAAARDEELVRLTSLPRISHLLGRKVVSESGVLLGAIGDVLIDRADGRIIGYTLRAPGVRGQLEAVFGRAPEGQPDYVRATADLRLGENLIVVPDGALVRHAGAAAPAAAAPGLRRWADPRRRWSAPAGGAREAPTAARTGERPDPTATTARLPIGDERGAGANVER